MARLERGSQAREMAEATDGNTGRGRNRRPKRADGRKKDLPEPKRTGKEEPEIARRTQDEAEGALNEPRSGAGAYTNEPQGGRPRPRRVEQSWGSEINGEIRKVKERRTGRLETHGEALREQRGNSNVSHSDVLFAERGEHGHVSNGESKGKWHQQKVRHDLTCFLLVSHLVS